MAIRRTAKTTTATAKPKTAAPKVTFPLAEINAMTIPELRELAKGLGLTEQKLKDGIRKELFDKGYVSRTENESASAQPKVAAKKTAPVKRSASKPEPEPQEDDETIEMDSDELLTLAKQVAELISSGSLDIGLDLVDDALTARLEWQEEETAKKKRAAAAAKKSASAKTPAKKIPAVVRKTDADDEMIAAQQESASKPKPAAKSGGPRMVKGASYTYKSRAGNALVKFVMFKKDENGAVDRTRAVVELEEALGARPVGKRIAVNIATLSN